MKRVFSLVRNGINFILVVSWIMLPLSPMSTGNLAFHAKLFRSSGPILNFPTNTGCVVVSSDVDLLGFAKARYDRRSVR